MEQTDPSTSAYTIESTPRRTQFKGYASEGFEKLYTEIIPALRVFLESLKPIQINLAHSEQFRAGEYIGFPVELTAFLNQYPEFKDKEINSEILAQRLKIEWWTLYTALVTVFMEYTHIIGALPDQAIITEIERNPMVEALENMCEKYLNTVSEIQLYYNAYSANRSSRFVNANPPQAAELAIRYQMKKNYGDNWDDNLPQGVELKRIFWDKVADLDIKVSKAMVSKVIFKSES